MFNAGSGTAILGRAPDFGLGVEFSDASSFIPDSSCFLGLRVTPMYKVIPPHNSKARSTKKLSGYPMGSDFQSHRPEWRPLNMGISTPMAPARIRACLLILK